MHKSPIKQCINTFPSINIAHNSKTYIIISLIFVLISYIGDIDIMCERLNLKYLFLNYPISSQHTHYSRIKYTLNLNKRGRPLKMFSQEIISNRKVPKQLEISRAFIIKANTGIKKPNPLRYPGEAEKWQNYSTIPNHRLTTEQGTLGHFTASEPAESHGLPINSQPANWAGAEPLASSPIQELMLKSLLQAIRLTCSTTEGCSFFFQNISSKGVFHIFKLRKLCVPRDSNKAEILINH